MKRGRGIQKRFLNRVFGEKKTRHEHIYHTKIFIGEKTLKKKVQLCKTRFSLRTSATSAERDLSYSYHKFVDFKRKACLRKITQGTFLKF